MGPLLAFPPLPLLPVDTYTHAHSRAHTQLPLLHALSPSLSAAIPGAGVWIQLDLSSCRGPADSRPPALSCPLLPRIYCTALLPLGQVGAATGASALVAVPSLSSALSGPSAQGQPNLLGLQRPRSACSTPGCRKGEDPRASRVTSSKPLGSITECALAWWRARGLLHAEFLCRSLVSLCCFHEAGPATEIGDWSWRPGSSTEWVSFHKLSDHQPHPNPKILSPSNRLAPELERTL